MSADDSTRTRILLAAGAAFAERGFEHATIREICEEAGVNGAAVNYHFGDKERLYRETIRHAHSLKIEQVPMPEWAPGTPPEERLRDFIRTMIRRMLVAHRLPWQERLMVREMFQPSGACRDLVEDYVRPHHLLLRSIIDELLPAGIPEPRRDQFAFSVIGQAVFYKLCRPIVEMLIAPDELQTSYPPDAIADHITTFTLAALRSIGADSAASPPQELPSSGTQRDSLTS